MTHSEKSNKTTTLPAFYDVTSVFLLVSTEDPLMKQKRNLIYSCGLYVSNSTWLNRELTVWES